jgi:hypothetical protein
MRLRADDRCLVVDVATTRPNANLVVDVYDLDEFGIAR